MELETRLPPTYRFDRTFEYNAAQGPRFDGEFPAVPQVPMKKFLGLDVNSRFGVAAGPAINSKWTSFYGRMGFDILTYKTVRTIERLAHPVPNWLYLKPGTPIENSEAPQVVTDVEPGNPLFAPVSGSIGTPSAPIEFWQADIARARAALLPGQILIVSVIGTALPGMSQDDFVREYETLAAMAREAGAQIVEANLSCPNVIEEEGDTFSNPELSGQIAAALRRGAKDLPTLLKIGEIEGDMAPFMRATAPHVNGIVLLNGVSRKIVDEHGNPAYGKGRERAGMQGYALHGLALKHVRQAVETIRKEHLDLAIVGVGGACTPDRIGAFIEAGAIGTVAATAVVLNPYLAVEMKKDRPDI